MTDVIETTKVVGNSILVSMDVTSLHRRKEVPLYAKHTKPIPRRHARTYPEGELFPICWETISKYKERRWKQRRQLHLQTSSCEKWRQKLALKAHINYFKKVWTRFIDDIF